MTVSPQLQRARDALYAIAGGSYASGDVRLARLTTAQRIAYFRSDAFIDWVRFENANGVEVFWLKDVDKTQGAGDIFTFFHQWRADNDMFSKTQLARIKLFLEQRGTAPAMTGNVEPCCFTPNQLGAMRKAMYRDPVASQMCPHELVRLFEAKLDGGDGIDLLEFWTIYWSAQFGLTRREKRAQVQAFAPHYASKIYPGVVEDNQALADAGGHVVIVSNGDQELAIAAAPVLGIDPRNVVGSNLLYAKNGRATGVVHSYEITCDPAWHARPQPGKAMSFHYWLHMNRERFGWDNIQDDKFVIAGRDGDSASSDGGMMTHLKPPALGNFMIDTPGEPDRLEKFFHVSSKYGWTKGQYFTLVQSPSKSGARPT